MLSISHEQHPRHVIFLTVIRPRYIQKHLRGLYPLPEYRPLWTYVWSMQSGEPPCVIHWPQTPASFKFCLRSPLCSVQSVRTLSNVVPSCVPDFWRLDIDRYIASLITLFDRDGLEYYSQMYSKRNCISNSQQEKMYRKPKRNPKSQRKSKSKPTSKRKSKSKPKSKGKSNQNEHQNENSNQNQNPNQNQNQNQNQNENQNQNQNQNEKNNLSFWLRICSCLNEKIKSPFMLWTEISNTSFRLHIFSLELKRSNCASRWHKNKQYVILVENLLLLR